MSEHSVPIIVKILFIALVLCGFGIGVLGTSVYWMGTIIKRYEHIEAIAYGPANDFYNAIKQQGTTFDPGKVNREGE
jgi:hypothetical protein